MRAGYNVWVASSAREAVIVARGGGYDLLLTDVVMPKQSGPELANQLKPPRVIFMSGFPADHLAQRGVPVGARYLAKPFDSQTLLDKVQVVLRQS